jgi:hypothetical protein
MTMLRRLRESQPNLQKRIFAQCKALFAYGPIVFVTNDVELRCVWVKDYPSTSFDEAPAIFSKFESHRRLDGQGLGIQQVVSVLLHLTFAEESVLCIDEPERGLSSKQAFKLGRLISKESQRRLQVSNGVMIVATHSPELMKGMLIENDRMAILRKESYHAPPRILSPEDVQIVWQDPYLSYSRALDGVFHDIVVFCESDGDCLLYEKALGKSAEHSDVKDILFCPTGGKSAIAKGLRGLRRINAKSVAIVDIDIFKVPKEANELLEACGASDSKETALSRCNKINEWKEKAERRWKAENGGGNFWNELKRRGEALLENDDVYKSLKEDLSNWGIFVCPAGELEGFEKQPKALVIPRELHKSEADLKAFEAQEPKYDGEWTELHVYSRLKRVAGQENKIADLLKQLKALGTYYTGSESYMEKVQQVLEPCARVTSDHGTKWVIEAIERDLVDWDRIAPFVEQVITQADDCRWCNAE